MRKTISVGLPKAGTHSLAAMFARAGVAAAHEPDVDALATAAQQGSTEAICDILRGQLRRFDLIASSVNSDLLPYWMACGQGVGVVLQVRRIPDWIESIASHHNQWHQSSPGWEYFKVRRYAKGVIPAAEERAGISVYPLSSYARYWNRTVVSVLDSVPKPSLFVLNIGRLAHRCADLEAFCDFRVRGRLSAAHEFQNPDRLLHRDSLPPGYLSGIVTTHCGEGIERLCRWGLPIEELLG